MRSEGSSGLSSVQPYLKQSEEYSYNLADNGSRQGALLSKVVTRNDYDSWGNPTTINVKTYGSSLGRLQLLQTKDTNNDYGSDADMQRLGRLKSTTVTTTRHDNNDTQRRYSSFDYYPLGHGMNGLLKTESIEPNDTENQKLTTTHTYDRYGNKRYSESEGHDGSTIVTRRSEENRYGHDGRYIASSQQRFPDGETRNTAMINKRNETYGAVESASDVNGVSTYTRYTAMGRQYWQGSDNGSWVQNYLTGNTANCPAATAYKSVQVSADGAKAEACFDRLGRSIRSRSLLPLDNGQNWSVVDTEYDSLGRVKRRSEPYQNSGIARYWSTFDYDILGRVLKVTLPDDSPSERSVGYTRYLGFITETENAKGQVKRETRNALGEVIEVIDGYHSSGDERSTSTYEYDAQGNLVKMMNNGANPTSIIYDKLGRKKSMNDPDKGRWSYRYNAFGELVEQTDAKLQKSRMHYDTLGRMIERVDRLRDGAIEQSSEWVYDRAVNGIGQLASVRMVDGTDNEKTFDSYRYDTLGRLVSSTRTLEGSYSYTSTQTYNSIGQLYQQFDGSNNQRDNGYRGVQYGYDAGVQVVVEDVRRTDSGQPFRVYDQILDVDARGNVVSSQHGMVFTTRIYDPATGRLTKVKSNKGSTLGSELQNLSYDWDTLGNLSSRHDQSGTKNLYERYDYDALNRLKVSNSTVNGQHYQQSVSYNAQGNIISKSDVESGASYQYGGQKTGCARTAGPHAVTQIGDTVYCYDENGNNISGDGRTLSYSSFDKVTSIITDDASIRFTYDHNRSRYRRDDTIKGKQSTTWYLGNVEVIESVTDANETKLEYRRSVGSAVESTIYINGEYQQERTSYLLSDHLGSIDLITDVDGSIIEHQSFDAWGMRRNALDAAMLVVQNQGNFDFATDFSSAITKRGFTGHEMLDAVGIIHMNGRIYDPKLGRFLQADPHIQEPFMTQSLNRYSYVINNPLNKTDPSGFGSLLFSFP